MTNILFKFGQLQLVMVNYAYDFNQSETGNYFEKIMNNYSMSVCWIRLRAVSLFSSVRHAHERASRFVRRTKQKERLLLV